MSYATAAIPPVVMRFNGKGSLLKYTAKRTLFAAIHEMRTVTRTRRVGKEIPNEFMHLRAARQKDRRPTERLYDILDRLAPRTRYVIEAAYLGGKQKKDIASSLGISPSRVSQIICGAFKQMRKEAGTYV